MACILYLSRQLGQLILPLETICTYFADYFNDKILVVGTYYYDCMNVQRKNRLKHKHRSVVQIQILLIISLEIIFIFGILFQIMVKGLYSFILNLILFIYFYTAGSY